MARVLVSRMSGARRTQQRTMLPVELVRRQSA